MVQIDFITALGRLLRDGALRDAYASSPQQTVGTLDVEEPARGALLSLSAEDLEFQARVLLRKRFDTVSCLLPETCARLGDRAWPSFVAYARFSWPRTQEPETLDAQNFLRWLARNRSALVSARERNRINFLSCRKRVAVHLVRDVVVRSRKRRGLQILLRSTSSQCRECVVYFELA